MTEIIKKAFKDINVKDAIFDSLKEDYKEFETTWFQKCINENRDAYVVEDKDGIGLFAALKNEAEEIILQNKTLPNIERIKICTLKIADRLKGNRLGEGIIAYILWSWQESNCDEIYLTSFDKLNL